MRAPRLDRRLLLEAPEDTSDGAGGVTRSWQVLGAVWAALEPRTGRAVDAAAGSVARMPYRITLRAAPAGSPARPKPGQRLRAGARVFHVQAVADEPGGAWLTCFAEEEEVSA